jgi:hypothetical protein
MFNSQGRAGCLIPVLAHRKVNLLRLPSERYLTYVCAFPAYRKIEIISYHTDLGSHPVTHED